MLCGGVHSGTADAATPLPDPPPQGGRERTACAAKARHCERSEAIQGHGKTARRTLDCFASLAMTVVGCAFYFLLPYSPLAIRHSHPPPTSSPPPPRSPASSH